MAFNRPGIAGQISKVLSRPDRSVASGQEVGIDQGSSERRGENSTYLTKSDGKTAILYRGDRLWAKVTVELETAGPVAVGYTSKLGNVLSGAGELLETGKAKEFVVSRGSNLYIASTSVNRVALRIEAWPWIEAIYGMLSGLVGIVRGGK